MDISDVSDLVAVKAAESAPSDDSHNDHLLQRMVRFRKDPLSWAHEISLFVRGVGWRGFDNYIGQPIFYRGYTTKIKNAVMASTILRQRLADLTEARIRREEQETLLDPHSTTFLMDREKRRSEIISQLVEITGGMVDQMICKMESKPTIRASYYSITQLLTRAYSGVHVSPEEVAKVKEVAARAAKKKQSIIFLPRHTSHVDYIALHLVCYRLGLTLPVVVAGDNLNFPIVGPFLQSIGAMWIRRSFDNDALYATLVQAYLDVMLQQGYNLECFIEGTRSRTGKLLGPRFGILSFLLDSVLSGRTEDAYICPVSLQYDKVIEVDTYVTELLGKPKQKENLADFLSASSVLSLNLGRIECRFHEPWSLKDFIQSQQTRKDQTTQEVLSTSGRDSETRIRLLRTLGYKVLSDINAASVIMPTALVGTVLLTLRGRGVGKGELIRRVDWLHSRVRANGGKVANFYDMPTSHVVERALEVLGPQLVGTTEGLAEETYHAVDRFQLSFYRNMTIHLFISESLIAASMYTKVKQGGGSISQRIRKGDLIEKVTFLSQLFRGEFIFPAGQGLQHNLEKAIQGLLQDGVIQTIPQEDEQKASSKAEDSPFFGLADVERQCGRQNFDFYCFLIWPFVDASWLSAVSMLVLVPPANSSIVWIDMKQASDVAQLFGRTLYHQGDLSYFEAINKEALKNGFARLQEEGILTVAKASKDAPKVGPTVRLSPEWTPDRNPETGELVPKGRLWEFIERIAQYRREGKNRRDGSAVSARVLALGSKLNSQLFDAVAMQAIPEISKTTKKTERRTKL